jgi:hypothetical protein
MKRGRRAVLRSSGYQTMAYQAVLARVPGQPVALTLSIPVWHKS